MIITPSQDFCSKLTDSNILRFNGSNRLDFAPGDKLKTFAGCRVEEYSRHPTGLLLNLGAFSYVVKFNPSLLRIRVGRYCSIAEDVFVMDGVHPIDAVSTSPFHYGPFFRKENINPSYVYSGPRDDFKHSYGPAIVGNDVWIGSHVRIMAGVKIGDGSVVAGGATVVKDVDPYTIVGGNPASIIRRRFNEDVSRDLLYLQWWDISPSQLAHVNFYNPREFIKKVRDLKESGHAEVYRPKVFEVAAGGLLNDVAE